MLIDFLNRQTVESIVVILGSTEICRLNRRGIIYSNPENAVSLNDIFSMSCDPTNNDFAEYRFILLAPILPVDKCNSCNFALHARVILLQALRVCTAQ